MISVFSTAAICIPAVHRWSAGGFRNVLPGTLHRPSSEAQRTWFRRSCCVRRPRCSGFPGCSPTERKMLPAVRHSPLGAPQVYSGLGAALQDRVIHAGSGNGDPPLMSGYSACRAGGLQWLPAPCSCLVCSFPAGSSPAFGSGEGLYCVFLFLGLAASLVRPGWSTKNHEVPTGSGTADRYRNLSRRFSSDILVPVMAACGEPAACQQRQSGKGQSKLRASRGCPPSEERWELPAQACCASPR